MTHDEGAEDVGTLGDLVVHDAQLRLQLVVVAPELVERDDRLVAGTVGVVHRRPVDGLLALPDGQFVGDREGLAVAHHHAVDRVVRDPGAHPGVHAHARDADLVLRALLCWNAYSGAPSRGVARAELGRGRALLAEALDAPGVHEPANRILGAMDESSRITLVGSVHPAIAAATSSTAVDASFPMQHMILMLQPDSVQQAALDTLVKQQYDPQSSSYHQFLTPDQFAARFGASTSDIGKVSAWLVSQGFQIDEVSPNNLAIVFSGNASQVQAAFKTEIRQYVVNGEVHHANASDVQIPSAFAGVVGGLVKLHDFHAKPFATGLKIAGQSTSGSTHSLAPADYAIIYDINSLYTAGVNGSGQSIAVLGRSNINMSDVQTFRTDFGLTANNPAVIVAQGSDPGVTANGDAVEATLDVEWAGAIAPKANVKFIIAASTSAADGIDLAAMYAVNHNVAPIIGVSFGSCEADMAAASAPSGSGNELTFYNALWQQAAVEGISVFVASGDSGAAGL